MTARAVRATGATSFATAPPLLHAPQRPRGAACKNAAPRTTPPRCAASPASSSPVPPPPPPPPTTTPMRGQARNKTPGHPAARQRETAESSATGAAEAYEDFARLLGPEQPTVSSEDRLNDDRQQHQPVSPATRPAEYASFDALLARSGGAGRPPKPMAKFWTHPVAPKPAAAPRIGDPEPAGLEHSREAQPSSGIVSPPPTPPSPRRAPSLRMSKAEIADGYGLMDQLFGNKPRRNPGANAPDDAIAEQSGNLPPSTEAQATLVQKPRLPGEPKRAVVAPTELPSSAAADTIQPGPPPALLPKPASSPITQGLRNNLDVSKGGSEVDSLAVQPIAPADTSPWTADEVESGYAQLQELFGGGQAGRKTSGMEKFAQDCFHDPESEVPPALQQSPVYPQDQALPPTSILDADPIPLLHLKPGRPQVASGVVPTLQSTATEADIVSLSQAKPPSEPSKPVPALDAPPARPELNPKVALTNHPGPMNSRPKLFKKTSLLKLSNPKLLVRPPFRVRFHLDSASDGGMASPSLQDAKTSSSLQIGNPGAEEDA